MRMVKPPAIGIDLGASYSCVAVWQNGKVEIIANDQGNRITPTYVGFTDIERLVGDDAKNRAVMNPENTIYNIKRLIGRRYDDPSIQNDIKHWPFHVTKKFGRAAIEIEYKGEVKQLDPEEISAMILTKMKQTAEAFLKVPVKDAVITVPAYFNNSQRQATLDACTITGLNVLRIMNEPTATALAYVLDKNLQGERNILVYDLGGGNFDVSIITVYEELLFEVRSTVGSTHLGGEDFDNRLLHFLKDEVKRIFGKDLSGNHKALRRIQMAAERAKCTLSSSTEANIELDALYLGIDFYTKITRACFEELCADLFCSTLQLVETALAYANMDKNAIDDIVLVGGSTRIHKIQSLLQDFFVGKSLNLSVNPDEAIAYGAAVYAAMLSGETSLAEIQNLEVIDITSQSLGIETVGGIMTNIFSCNTHIPCRQTLVFTTYADNQSVIPLQIFEGVQTLAKDNNLLGTFDIVEIHPAFRGVPSIEITFVLDYNSILNISAKDMEFDKYYNILITGDCRIHLDQAEIDRMIADAEQYRQEDEKQKDLITIRNHLERYVFSFRQLARKLLSLEDKSIIERECENCIKWMDNNLLAEKDEYEEWYEQLSSLRSSIMAKWYSNNVNSAQAAQSTGHSCGQEAREVNTQGVTATKS